MRVWRNPGGAVEGACARVSEFQQAIDVLAVVRRELLLSKTGQMDHRVRRTCKEACTEAKKEVAEAGSGRPRWRGQVGPIGGGAGIGPGVGVVAASGRRGDSSQFEIQTCHLCRSESVRTFRSSGKGEQWSGRSGSVAQGKRCLETFVGGRRRSPAAGQDVGRTTSGSGSNASLWYSFGSGTGASWGPFFDDGILDQPRWFSTHELLQSARMRWARRAVGAQCVRCDAESQCGQSHVEGSQCVISRRCRSRYGLRAARVGASHPVFQFPRRLRRGVTSMSCAERWREVVMDRSVDDSD